VRRLKPVNIGNHKLTPKTLKCRKSRPSGDLIPGTSIYRICIMSVCFKIQALINLYTYVFYRVCSQNFKLNKNSSSANNRKRKVYMAVAKVQQHKYLLVFIITRCSSASLGGL